jgi:DNA-binding response OmpR family regulator
MKTLAIRKALVIDDDEGVLYGISSVLSQHFSPPIEIVGAVSTASGYSKFFSEAPDLVFLDVHFGEAAEPQGIELLKRVKQVKVREKVPFILFSDRDTITEQLTGLEEEYLPDDFLSKPLPEIELVAKVRQWDRVLHAERKLISQKEHLQKRAVELATQNITAVKQLGDQHAIAALGLFTRGLITLFADSLLTIRGYVRLVELTGQDPEIREAAFERLVKSVQRSTDFPNSLLSSLRLYFEGSLDKPEVVEVSGILNGLVEMARHEFKRHGFEVDKDLAGKGYCSFVPVFFVQTVISLLLMFRDTAMPGSVLHAKTQHRASNMDITFEYPVRAEVKRQLERAGDRPAIEAKSEVPAVFSLRSATEAAQKIGGELLVSTEKDNLTLRLTIPLASSRQDPMKHAEY